MDVKKVIWLSLPTLCIFYVSSFSRAPVYRPYHEVFGNGEYYLDLYFETNPRGPLQPQTGPRKVRVNGYLVTGEQEQRVSGHWMKLGEQTYYAFALPHGRFTGTLIAAREGSCEPRLKFQIQGERLTNAGVLKAGFCN